MPSKGTSSVISKAYKQAQNLFLTRRLSESLQALQPIIALQDSDEEPQESSTSTPRPLIASATKGARIKVWNLFLTLLNSILELEPDERKSQFSSTEWRSLALKARDGSIWEEVVQAGYGGVEGDVDAEVVSNLATLLISQSPSQILNQQRLESYLATYNQASLNTADPFLSSDSPSSDVRARVSNASGTDTPRDLNSRIKILELYTLHVLPRNDEWQYAREFITIDDTLDEERREGFLQTLQTLEDQKENHQDRNVNVSSQQSMGHKDPKDQGTAQEVRSFLQEKEAAESSEAKGHRRLDSGEDYGIDDPVLKKAVKSQTQSSTNAPKWSHTRPSKYPSVSKHTTPSGQAAQGAYKHSLALVRVLQRIVLNFAKSTSRSPAALGRTILFLIAIVVALNKHDIRNRVQNIIGSAWQKLRRTAGMGIKVSYI